MTHFVDHIEGHTWHGRKGAVKNDFRYSIDYVCLDAEAPVEGPRLFSRNGKNLLSLQDRDHGGPPNEGRGAPWARAVLDQYQIRADGQLLLLAQPRVLGHVFNPVSFWLAHNADGALIAVIAEVTNTFGDRHSYLAARADGGAIGPSDKLKAAKIFHVSPFQPISGGYVFRFDIRDDRIGIWIDFDADGGENGVIATLTGRRKPMSDLSALRALVRRPFGSRRVLALIHWQALKLWWKGARYKPRPEPPASEVSR
ncbi:hypothetical protein FIU97_00320 [Roseivivax sp. THAF40]|uniref:DUF1365 domain-containing protein n=1 Tax=unclassified Roseivivax TaxID=2639302 RepID=UPI0012684AE3|nr:MULTISPECIES: DUF1365 domain-containing protein [unclassified Roseivivax]QFS81281.1 hypothetical protein FIV09_00405 [Roseivivax sp. THAF197b]QFT45010.1 hypothetical protein FIU97_00320 [Roseivivax sp. THAF40]